MFMTCGINSRRQIASLQEMNPGEQIAGLLPLLESLSLDCLWNPLPCLNRTLPKVRGFTDF